MNWKIALSTGVASAALIFGAETALGTPIAPGYTVDFITTPGTATGDVVVVGGAVFVGVGGFGVGTQSVVRIDGGGTTVLADGFNSLGGFAYDSINDRLIFGDNAGELAGTATGDTLYVIDDPFGSPGTPDSALGLELLGAGSIPGFADVILDPSDITGDTLFATDSWVGSLPAPPAGSLLEVAIGSPSSSVVEGGLVYSSGLAADATTLYIGEVLLGFDGQISTVPLASTGDSFTTLATLASGVFDLELSADGSLIVTSGGSVLRITTDDGPQTGGASVATGFGFATGLFEAEGGVIYVLDGFAGAGDLDKIWVLTPIPEPSTGLTAAAGLLALAARRRRAVRASACRRREVKD